MLNKYSITFRNISNQDEKIFLENAKVLKKILKFVVKETQLSGKFVVSFNLINSIDIKKMKKKYFNINEVTDVISFPQMETFNGITDLGDVFINAEILESQSAEIGSNIETEVKYLFMHGLLHLIGYDHIVEDDFKLMREKEKEIFNKLKIRNEK